MQSIKPYWVGSAVVIMAGSVWFSLCPGACATLWANHHHHFIADELMKAFTFIVEWPVIVVAIAAYLIKDWRVGLWAGIIYACQGLTINLLKSFFNAPRPLVELTEAGLRQLENIPLLSWQSFPSGHTASAFMGFGILASLSRSPAWQISCIIMAASAGYSRMYLGQHYLHDVIGGACISLIWLIFFIRLKLKFRSALMQNEQ